MRSSILDAVGSPLVAISSPDGATVAAKLEGFNPGGSAKDRPAMAMIDEAERAGEIEPGDRLVEPTSGNTGIGLAVAAAAKDYDLTIVMPSSKSPERRQLLRAYGADLELVDGDMEDARERAAEIASGEGAVEMGQFENPANAEAHYRTTAEEILDQVDGRAIDAFVAGVGTGGTITGTARRLREEFPEMEVVAVEPERSAVLTRKLGEGDEAVEIGEDDFQGMGPGFVSDLLDTELVTSVETVALADAEDEARRLAREEGILVGQSSGAASVAARRVAERIARPDLDCSESDDCPLVVTVFPDSGERYLSTGMFE